jgi:flagellin
MIGNSSLLGAILGINNSQAMLDKYNLQLQTGKKINSAADNASGLTIADSLLSQANGLDAGTSNANDAKGILSIADGALMSYGDTLQLMKTKAVSAASDAASPDSRKALQADINNFMSSLNKIASDTQFNGIGLLNGAFSNKSFQVGAYSGQTVDISIMSVASQKIGHLTESVGSSVTAGTTGATLSINGATIAQVTTSGTGADGANLLAKAINDKTSTSGVIATATNSVTGASVAGGSIADGDLKINGISIGAVNVTANDSSGSLASAINAVSNQTGVKATINGNGAIQLTSSDGGNIHLTEANGGAAKAGLTAGTNFGKITMSSKDGISIQNGSAVDGLNALTTSNYTLSSINVTTQVGAQRAMKLIDNAISEIGSIQSDVGSATNQLDRVVSVNTVTAQNVKAAYQNIMGADLASVQEQIKTWTVQNQAAMYSFTLAQQTQQNVLSILR